MFNGQGLWTSDPERDRVAEFLVFSLHDRRCRTKRFHPLRFFRREWAVFTLHRPINQKDRGLFFHPFILTILGLFLRNFLERR